MSTAQPEASHGGRAESCAARHRRWGGCGEATDPKRAPWAAEEGLWDMIFVGVFLRFSRVFLRFSRVFLWLSVFFETFGSFWGDEKAKIVLFRGYGAGDNPRSFSKGMRRPLSSSL